MSEASSVEMMPLCLLNTMSNIGQKVIDVIHGGCYTVHYVL
jgi:hypothetical protein